MAQQISESELVLRNCKSSGKCKNLGKSDAQVISRLFLSVNLAAAGYSFGRRIKRDPNILEKRK